MCGGGVCAFGLRGASVARLRRVLGERRHRRRIRDVAKPRLRRKEKRRGSLLYSA